MKKIILKTVEITLKTSITHTSPSLPLRGGVPFGPVGFYIHAINGILLISYSRLKIYCKTIYFEENSRFKLLTLQK